MELVDGDSKSPTLISNVEVLLLLKKNVEARAEEEEAFQKKRRNQNKRNQPRKPQPEFRHRDWVEEEVYRYLRGTPCVALDPHRRDEFHSKLKANKKLLRATAPGGIPATATKQEADAAVTTTAAATTDDGTNQATTTATTTTGFGLTEAEALQIMNMMPQQLVEVHLMVDELQSRMSEQRQEQFLNFITSYTTTATTATNPPTATTTNTTTTSQEEDHHHNDDGTTTTMTDNQETTVPQPQQPVVQPKQEDGGNKNNKHGMEIDHENGKPQAVVKIKKETEEESSSSRKQTYGII